ncbi:2TM domain-containing protein [Xenorhabdus entomophaga]|uniref:2TM domain-containing protein n=1 Tax=Xenorhabdus entomophaga TaxID=3136257 RepID=UPI003BF60547
MIYRARRKIEFGLHLTIYIIVNVALAIINLFNFETIWFIYPLLGWLLGLLIHALITFTGWPSLIWKKMLARELV